MAQAQKGLAPEAEIPDRKQHDVGFDQKLGAKVPLDLTFTDENGKEVTIKECVDGKPCILILAYYRCPMLCGEVLAGALDVCKMLKTLTIGKDFNIVTVSFDPKESPDLALAKKRHFVNEYGRKEADFGWKFLTSKDKQAIEQLASSVGFRFEYDKSIKEYNHASGIMIMTPEGIVSRYMPGIEYFDRDDDGKVSKDASKSLRLALVDAGDGQIGSISDRAFLTCYRYNPHTGKYSADVKFLVRCGGVLTLVVIGIGFLIEYRRMRKRRGTIDLVPEMDRAI